MVSSVREHGPFEMPDFALAIPGLMQRFPPELRREAERLVEDAAVVTLDMEPDEVTGEVALDDRSVGVRWALSEAGWDGQSDGGPEFHELALCAVLAAAQRRQDAPTDADLDAAEEDFQEWLEQRLKRALTDQELAYVEKVDKRFRRARIVGAIYDQDMVRLHSRWGIDSMEPLELWPVTPKSLREFWTYVALALDEKGLTIPRFMLEAADLAGGRQRLSHWRRSLELPRWVEKVRSVARAVTADSTLPHVLPVDFRLMINLQEIRLQQRFSPEGTFQTVPVAELADLGQHLSAGRLQVPPEAALLLRVCLEQQRSQGGSAFRLEEKSAAALLVGLLAQPGLESRLVSLDDVPLLRPTEPLVWRTRPSASGDHLELFLALAGGIEAPLPLRLLSVDPPLYLTLDSMFAGPLWFGDDSRIEGPIAVPLAALDSADGVQFLQKLGVDLPPFLAERIVHEPLKVQVRAGSLAKSPVSSAEYVVMQVEALDSEGRVVERLRHDGWWDAETDDRIEDGKIRVFDRAFLGMAQGALDTFRSVYDPEHEGFRVRLTRQFPDQFHQWAQSLPEGVSLIADDRLQTILADPLIARVRLEAKQAESIDWFDLRLMFEIEGADLKAAEIRRLVAARGGFVRLADGTWRRVELRLSEEHQAMIDQLGIELEELGEESHRLHWRQLTEETAAELIDPKAWQRVARRLAAAELEEKPPVSADLQVTLRPYQVEGFHFLSYLTLNGFGGILADDMGLGKTVQSIAWLLWLRSRMDAAEGIPPALVVCPKSVLDVWGAELKKASPSLRIKVLRERDDLDMMELVTALDVLVINYAQLRSLITDLKDIVMLAVILDEGQQIKNPDCQAARAARKLQAHNRLVLTGTPLENRLLDLWSLMAFATPGALGDRSYFQKFFDRRKDGRAAARLSARLRPFLLRRTKGQVAQDLPLRSEEAMVCEMTPPQARAYRDELARAQQLVLSSAGFEGGGRQRFAILQALTRLRQVCCHPKLLDEHAGSEDSAKMLATLELLEELHAEGHKVLLFSQFVTMLDLLRAKLEELEIPYHWLTGATQHRATVVDAFQQDERASVFLLSLKAGGSGLNLTAASYVILYDPWWNPAVEAQAIDRAHRIGQTQPVMAYRMITKDTIEEKIMTLQQKKQIMATNILGDDAFARSLDQNDFAYLFDLEREEQAWQRELKAE